MTPQEMAAELIADVQSASHASLALADATLGDGPGFDPDSVAMDAFDCGVMAGFTETLRALISRGWLPVGTC